MSTSQEYGSELNAVSAARRQAKAAGIPHYAVETRYGWIDSPQKPSLRYGKVWELQADGMKYHG